MGYVVSCLWMRERERKCKFADYLQFKWNTEEQRANVGRGGRTALLYQMQARSIFHWFPCKFQEADQMLTMVVVCCCCCNQLRALFFLFPSSFSITSTLLLPCALIIKCLLISSFLPHIQQILIPPANRCVVAELQQFRNLDTRYSLVKS